MGAAKSNERFRVQQQVTDAIRALCDSGRMRFKRHRRWPSSIAPFPEGVTGEIIGQDGYVFYSVKHPDCELRAVIPCHPDLNLRQRAARELIFEDTALVMAVAVMEDEGRRWWPPGVARPLASV